MDIILVVTIVSLLALLLWAIMGGKEKSAAEDTSGPDKEATFRRRASDREIEQEYPDEPEELKGPAGPGEVPGGGDRRAGGRRTTDREAPEEGTDKHEKLEFKLPYLADEIIPETSQFRMYRRTLINSEIYAAKGDFTTSISLFEGVRSRINDRDIRMKIETNIEYLKHYQKKKQEQKKRREEEARKMAAEGGPGESRKGNEVKLMIDGSVPDNINIGPMPNTINIGIIDPSRNMDADTIAEKVKEKLKGEGFRPLTPDMEADEILDQVRRLQEDTSLLKEAAVVRESGEDDRSAEKLRRMAREGELRKEIRDLKDKIEAMEAEKPLDGSHLDRLEEIKKELDIDGLKDDLDALAGVKNEISELKKAMSAMEGKAVPDSEKEPALTQARYDRPIPVTLDTAPIEALLDRLPAQTAPPAGEIQPPPGMKPDGAPEKTREKEIQKEQEADDADDFELLSEYGRDRDIDNLSDDDIFEKILKDGDESDENSFEVIGEKKEEFEEMNLTDPEIESKRREEASFYKKLLKTDRRKTRELPILKVSYDFTKLPDEFSLSREKNILEYSFYKYKPMLQRADDFIKKRKVRDAINYYKVVMSQNIPPEFKAMIRKNLKDLNEYLEKYLTGE